MSQQIHLQLKWDLAVAQLLHRDPELNTEKVSKTPGRISEDLQCRTQRDRFEIKVHLKDKRNSNEMQVYVL